MDKEDKQPAFRIEKIDPDTGETVVVIQKGIIGPIANQLKNTSDRRKASRILRKLGKILGRCGDIHYSTNAHAQKADTEWVHTILRSRNRVEV